MPDSTVEEDIGEIKREQIEDAWYERKPLRQIAEETGLPIEVVNRSIKRLEKALFGGKVQRHGQQGHL
jgi:hypothetical protein